jgi:hypothetical protein
VRARASVFDEFGSPIARHVSRRSHYAIRSLRTFVTDPSVAVGCWVGGRRTVARLAGDAAGTAPVITRVYFRYAMRESA